ncbi:MAG: NTP transferase domain-containing protein [Acidobacteriota bacterium]
MRPAAVVLAAGEGKRLKTTRAKVLHEAAGRPLLDHVLAALAPLHPEPVVVVVGHLRVQVEGHLRGKGLETVVQDPPRGTGDAVAKALPALPRDGDLLVVSGDVPLVTTGSLERLLAARRQGAAAALLSAVLPEGGGYGRVVRSPDGSVQAIVEARDATVEQRALHEVNAGTYAFELEALREALPRVRPANDQGEYYLTDVIGLLVGGGRQVVAVTLEGPSEMAGVNTRDELAQVHHLLNRRIVGRLQAEGVTVLDPATTWIDFDCTVGADTVLEPGVHLRRGCRVGRSCRVGAHAVLSGVTLPDGAVVAPLTLLEA